MKQLKCTAPWGALPHLPCTSRPCWGKASFGARLAARFVLLLRRVRRGVASGKAKLKNSVPAAASSLQLFYILKTKIFLGKKLGRYAAINKRKTLDASCPASCGQCFKTKTSGAGVVRARPPHKKAENFASKNKD